jgi:hypothetical protein
MRVPADKLPAFVVAETSERAQAVFWVIDSKRPENSDANALAQLRRGIEQQVAAADDQAYVNELKRKHKAQIVDLERSAGSKK